MAGYDVPAFYDGAADYDVGLAAALSQAIASGIAGKRAKTYKEFVERYAKKEPKNWHDIEKERQEKLRQILRETLSPTVPNIEAVLEDLGPTAADVGEMLDQLKVQPNFALELLLLSEFI